MSFVYNALLFLHFIGLASLLGGFLVQITSSEKGVNRAMVDGAVTQLVTGLAMFSIADMGLVEEELEPIKFTVKLAIVIVITVLAFVGRRKPAPQVGLWATIGALTLVNVAIAVFA